MALTPVEIVDFLHREDSLATPRSSPWPTADTDQDIRGVDWSELFPSRRPQSDGAEWDLYGDEWDPEFPTDFFEAVGNRSGRGPTALDKNDMSGRPDVCAWYQPLHFHGLDWGIYLREDCLLRIAADISAFLPGPAIPSPNLGKALIRAAFATLYLHEAYHHKTESFGIRLHVIERTGCYTEYFKQVYVPLRAGKSDELHEEALANAESYTRLSEPAYKKWLSRPVLEATYGYLLWRFPLDPPGYRQASRLLTDSSFDQLEYLLKSQVQEKRIVPYRSVGDWQLAPRVNQSFFTCRSDIWTIVSPGIRGVLPTAIPYPSVSTAVLNRALSRIGYGVVKGGKGSHVKLAATGRPNIILPGKRKDLSPVVVRNVAKTLGYRTAEELRTGLGI